MTAIDAAGIYLDRGFLPIPIPHREKAPKVDGWPAMRLTKADLARYFTEVPANVGLILGDPYGTADVDLDSGEAVTIGRQLLPETAMVFGRASKPASHFFYRSDPPVRSKRYLDPVDKACIVELRCRKSDGTIGLQTVVPPSTHPSGEEIRFEEGCAGHPANIDAPILQAAVAHVAATALLARHWPGEKTGRNQAFIALAGALVRGGWSVEQAITLHAGIYAILWGAQANLAACRAEVAATFEKHGEGFQTTGRQCLEGLIEKVAVRTALSWLGISQSVPARSEPKTSSVALPKGFSLDDLMLNPAIAAPELMLEGLLPKCGLVLLGGRPKDGKSWLACQIALSVVTGQALGGWLRVRHPGRVQLWALEDQFALTKDKIGKLLRGGLPDAAPDMRIYAELGRPILSGGDQILRAALKEHPADLVILDSLFKLSGAPPQHYDISQRDYDLIERVRQIAIDAKCCAVIVMHTKKGAQGGNPIENLLGTSGTPAAADVVAELKRFRQGGKLTIVGRCVPIDDYELAWHGGPDEWGWSIQDQGEQAGMGETSEEVLAYLEAQGPTKPAIIAAALHKSFRSVWSALLRLQEKGKTTKQADKKWDVAR